MSKVESLTQLRLWIKVRADKTTSAALTGGGLRDGRCRAVVGLSRLCVDRLLDAAEAVD
jgi:hypothetical protein